jgi:hypothetical protein
VELLPIVHNYYFRGKAFRRRGYASAERREDDFWVVPGVWPGQEISSAVSSPRTQWGTVAFSRVTSAPRARISAGDVVDCLLCLGRAAETRTDVVGDGAVR